MHESGERCVDKRLCVYWPLDDAWYPGIVKSYDDQTKEHVILYEDGMEETLMLSNEKLQWAEARPRSQCADLRHKIKDEHSRKCEHRECPKQLSFHHTGKKGGSRLCGEPRLEGVVKSVERKRCEHRDCIRFPTCNHEGEKSGRFCSQHRLTGMILVTMKKCEHRGCTKQPSFNNQGETARRFCAEHKLGDMVNVKNRNRKKCEHSDCTKLPSYNHEGKMERRFCAKHKLKGMVNLSYKKREKCLKQPSKIVKKKLSHVVGKQFVDKGRYVYWPLDDAWYPGTAKSYDDKTKEHVIQYKDGMDENLMLSKERFHWAETSPKSQLRSKIKAKSGVKRCEHTGCSTRSTFNHRGEIGGRFCAEHKLSAMVDVTGKRCEHRGCTTSPSFNHQHEVGTRFCAKHKLKGMVRHGRKQCEHKGCTKQPSFNYEGEKRGRFCAAHKLMGMEVKRKKCEHPGCTKQRVCNYPGEVKKRFCVEHKLEGMVDVANKKCEHKGCMTRPHYNHEGEKRGRFCAEHKLKDMVDVKNKQCEHKGCTKQPSFNYEGEKRGQLRFCAVHKLRGMVDKRNCKHRRRTPRHQCADPEVEVEQGKQNPNGACQHLACNEAPLFNYYNFGRRQNAMYCGDHKLEGMVNVSDIVDVKEEVVGEG